MYMRDNNNNFIQKDNISYKKKELFIIKNLY